MLERFRTLIIFSVAAALIGTMASFAFMSSTKAPTAIEQKNNKNETIKILAVKGEKEIAKEAPVFLPEPVSILAVGDMMLGRNVENLMKKNDADYPFSGVKPFFETFDFVFANLEGPIPKKHRPTPSGSTQFSFVKETGETLKRNGVDIVSLANNHTFDYGKENFENTRLTLSEAGLLNVGSQRSTDKMYVVTTTIRSEPVAFVALNDVFGILDLKSALQTVQTFATDDSFLFVSIHWGDEYKVVGNKRQASIARQLIDAGADTVIGHHPHVVQHIEMYKNKPIFYSLGNFIFDQYFSKNTQEGLAISLNLKDDIVTYTLHPVEIPKSQPAFMEGEKKEKFLQALAERSQKALKEDIKKGMFETPRVKK